MCVAIKRERRELLTPQHQPLSTLIVTRCTQSVWTAHTYRWVHSSPASMDPSVQLPLRHRLRKGARCCQS